MKPKPIEIRNFLANLLLPVAVGIYPVLFLFARNAKILTLQDMVMPAGLATLVAVIGFCLFLLAQKRLSAASLSMAVFMVIYYLYGVLISELLKRDIIPVRQYIFLPVAVGVGAYAGYFIAKIRQSAAVIIQKILLVIAVGLVVFNVATAAPVEIQKAFQSHSVLAPSTGQAASVTTSKKYPDIYFIIFDEYVGFQAMRDYWHDDSVDQFASFLAQNHFFLAPDSRSATYNTLTELSSRLNLRQFTMNTDSSIMQSALHDNRVMSILKSYGYSTVAIDMAFQGIKADRTVSFSAADIEGIGSDEFRKNFIQGSMASAFGNLLLNENEEGIKQKQAIDYALQQTTSQPKSSTPLFVFAHVLLPHDPFIFDANGNLNPPQDFYDWHYYQGQYQYTTKVAEQLITKLLAQADPNNPPVIIVQSDHGARNMVSRTTGNIAIYGMLEQYPSDYYTMILNEMYLPGYDTSQLPADLAPIRTFELVLNYYLNAGVSVDPNCPCNK